MSTLQIGFAAIASIAAPASAQTSADRFKADVAYLADDLLEGRGTGTRGYDLAARYVAARFEALGLEPAGTNGWYQEVPFLSARSDPAHPSALTIGGVHCTNGKGRSRTRLHKCT